MDVSDRDDFAADYDDSFYIENYETAENRRNVLGRAWDYDRADCIDGGDCGMYVDVIQHRNRIV